MKIEEMKIEERKEEYRRREENWRENEENVGQVKSRTSAIKKV